MGRDIRRQVVVLNVPVELDEDGAETWDWGTLIETAEPVHVMAVGPLYVPGQPRQPLRLVT